MKVLRGTAIDENRLRNWGLDCDCTFWNVGLRPGSAIYPVKIIENKNGRLKADTCNVL